MLARVWIWKKKISNKIVFGDLICSIFIPINDLNYYNEYLIDNVYFSEGLISNKFSKNEVANMKKFRFNQSRFAINHYSPCNFEITIKFIKKNLVDPLAGLWCLFKEEISFVMT